jgi:hypothetical protein
VNQLTLEGRLQEQLTLEKLDVRSIVRRIESFSPQMRPGALAQLAEQLTLNQVLDIDELSSAGQPAVPTGIGRRSERLRRTLNHHWPRRLDRSIGAAPRRGATQATQVH